MNRTIRALYLGLALAGLSTSNMAQQPSPSPQIPAEAQKAVLVFVGDGQITLNGKPANLSPAAQIRGTNNLIVLPQALHGKYPARVLLDAQGNIRKVWILDGTP
jgi:hypothetical protein